MQVSTFPDGHQVKKQKNSRDVFEQALVLESRGRAEEAAAKYRALISRNAEHDRALFRLGLSLLGKGEVEAATRYLERAVEVRRDEPTYLLSLGEAYRLQGKVELAGAVLTYAVNIDPDLTEAHEKLAPIRMHAGAYEEALSHLEKVAALRPDDPLAHVGLAWALLLLNRPAQALARAERAIELAPNLAGAHRCAGDSLDMLGDKQRSLESYRRVLELDPGDSVAHSNLIISMLTEPSHDAKAVLAEARAWEAQHALPLRAHQREHQNVRDPDRRLRIGYVSPDFRAHPVQQFLVPLLQRHDPNAVEIFLYSSVERADARTEWYQGFAGDRFRDIRPLSDVEAAELVRRDQIDVLVDLAVHGPGNRLRVFACKPAPIQMTWLGYAGTTGLASIDYRITDPYLDPLDADLSVYSESSLRLPATFWSYDALEVNLVVNPAPAVERGFVTFGSFNSPRKVHSRAVALWARVLAAVPTSRLLFYTEEYGRAGALRIFAEAGVDTNRVEFVGRVSRREYLERHHGCDIALDTFPFSGGTTTLDSAWMGVPTVTLLGSTVLQRAGYAIATHLGLPKLVARSEDEFVERAAALASNLEALSALRAG
ncbi:MAG TPA: tetratricopeptide repeat protein, partial [Polyangiaceae bacterium]|nr:tetratricopeptide repeat protein [Polyangiaceae bacterium]